MRQTFLKTMKRKLLFVCLMSGLFGTISCTFKRMPERVLVSVEYTRTGTMAGYEYEGRAHQDSSGAFVLRAMREPYGPLFEKKLDAAAMQKFRQIIEDEKMYKYKDRYEPMMRVYDGTMWDFTARFSDGSVIRSHGSNASPKGDGLQRICDYMQELVGDSVAKPVESENAEQSEE